MLQPLNLNFYGPLNNILAKIIRDKVTSNESLKLGKEQFADILMNAWERIQPSWLKKGFKLSGILTSKGIVRNAIKDEEIFKSLPYDKDGILFFRINRTGIERS